METKKYETIIDKLSMPDYDILFRQGGDGFLQVEYGHEQRLYVPDSFRILGVDDAIKEKKVKGLIETVPGLRTNLFHFDPEVLNFKTLIEEIKDCEKQFKSMDNLKIQSRLIHLPIAFEDSETKKSVAKYSESIRKDAPNVIDGYNLDYIAMCNGVTVEEVKKLLLSTEWFNSGCGFWPGGGFFWPLDPRCALVVPKYNPPRIWTPEGSVGLGGPCLFTYTTPAGGGYQLFGRTIPTFQFAMKHPQFKESPCLYRNKDRIKFFEVSEEEILDIYKHVHEETDYEYQIEDGEINAKEYIDWLNSPKIKKETEIFKKNQAEGLKTAPRL